MSAKLMHVQQPQRIDHAHIRLPNNLAAPLRRSVAAQCGSLSMAQMVLKPAACAPMSMPPAPANKLMAEELMRGLVLVREACP